MQAATWRDELAETFEFIAKENEELGHPIKAKRSLQKAKELRYDAMAFKYEIVKELRLMD